MPTSQVFGHVHGALVIFIYVPTNLSTTTKDVYNDSFRPNKEHSPTFNFKSSVYKSITNAQDLSIFCIINLHIVEQGMFTVIFYAKQLSFQFHNPSPVAFWLNAALRRNVVEKKRRYDRYGARKRFEIQSPF